MSNSSLGGFFIAGIIPVFDNVFPDENARHETGHFCFYQREPKLTDDLFIIPTSNLCVERLSRLR